MRKLYVGNLQVYMGIGGESFVVYVGTAISLIRLHGQPLEPVCRQPTGYMIWSKVGGTAKFRHQGAVCRQPTSYMIASKVGGTAKFRHQGAVCRQPTSLTWGCWTAFKPVCWHSYKSCGACWTAFGACMSATYKSTWGLLSKAWGAQQSSGNLGMSVLGLLDNLQAYMIGAKWGAQQSCRHQPLEPVCRQPTSYMIGAKWVAQQSSGIRELYVGNLQVYMGIAETKFWGGMLAKFRSCRELYVWTTYRLHDWNKVGDTVLSGLQASAFGACMLATYKSYQGCWTAKVAVCWHSYKSHGHAGPPLEPVCRQPTGYMIGAKWGAQQSSGIRELYVGNLQVLSGLLDPKGCMSATYRSYGICWTTGSYGVAGSGGIIKI